MRVAGLPEPARGPVPVRTVPRHGGSTPPVLIRNLYIHAPFCFRRCSYCDFAVTATREPPVAAWLDAIGSELSWAAAGVRLELDTLYVGGGTPSLLGAAGMRELGERLRPRAQWDEARIEWTAEANPESFGPELASAWRRTGVNRLSFGAQTFDEAALRWMGRLHGPDGPLRAVAAARAAGFDDISLDLIFGLPARLGRDWAADLDRAIALEPDHVSLYGLTAEPATPLGRWVAEGRERLADEASYEEEYLLAAERLTGEGYEHYEVSNFARPGRASRHNRSYWEGAPYLGLGPGAHSYLPPARRWNTRDWTEYRRRLESGAPAVDGTEEVGEPEQRLERTWLGLRTSAGVQPDGPGQLRLAETWRRHGWADPATDGRVRLTARGWLLLDRLAVDLDAASAAGADEKLDARRGRRAHLRRASGDF